DGGLERRASLALLLDLVHQHRDSPDVWLEGLLRGAAYSRALADGTDWAVGEAWRRTRDGWGVYARNEVLSVALQGLFWAQLRMVEELGGQVQTTAEAAALLLRAVAEEFGAEWMG